MVALLRTCGTYEPPTAHGHEQEYNPKQPRELLESATNKQEPVAEIAGRGDGTAKLHSLTVRCVMVETMATVPGVEVRVSRANSANLWTKVLSSDENGACSFDGLDAGDYHIFPAKCPPGLAASFTRQRGIAVTQAVPGDSVLIRLQETWIAGVRFENGELVHLESGKRPPGLMPAATVSRAPGHGISAPGTIESNAEFRFVLRDGTALSSNATLQVLAYGRESGFADVQIPIVRASEYEGPLSVDLTTSGDGVAAARVRINVRDSADQPVDIGVFTLVNQIPRPKFGAKVLRLNPNTWRDVPVRSGWKIRMPTMPIDWTELSSEPLTLDCPAASEREIEVRIPFRMQSIEILLERNGAPLGEKLWFQIQGEFAGELGQVVARRGQASLTYGDLPTFWLPTGSSQLLVTDQRGSWKKRWPLGIVPQEGTQEVVIDLAN